jgi:hypothetical protein
MTSPGGTGDWTLEPVPELQGYAVEWAEPGALLLSRRDRLYRASAPGAPLTPVARFPVPRWRAMAARLRALQRLLRFFFYNVVRLPDGSLFASFDRELGVLRQGTFERLGGLSRACRVLRSACAVTPEGHVYLGEYSANPDRGPMHVYRYVPGESAVEPVHRFPPGAVRHIHGIYRDPFTGALWCTTGDRAGECQVLRSEDGFRRVEVVGAGDETWRTVSLQFTEDAVYYGTDAQFDRNHLYRLERRSGRRDVLGPVDGPVFYSHALGRDLFFTVCAELCPSQVGRCATLWHVSEGDRLSPIRSFEKDALSVHWFMFGTLHFPRGPGWADETLLHGVALRGADDRSFRLRRRSRPADRSGRDPRSEARPGAARPPG